MPDVRIDSFLHGRISPAVAGRGDLKLTGAEEMVNLLPVPQGGLTLRPGTFFVRKQTDQTKASRLIPFAIDDDVQYILEFGDLKVWMYEWQKCGEYMWGWSTPTEIVSPFSATQIWEFDYEQFNNRMAFVHPDVAPQFFEDNTGWGFTALTFSVREWTTASAGDFYDIMEDPTARNDQEYEIGTIVKVSGTPDVFYRALQPVPAGVDIAETAFWEVLTNNPLENPFVNGFYPGVVEVWQDRMMFAGFTGAPMKVKGSRIGVYRDFLVGTLYSDGVEFDILTKKDSRIQWLASKTEMFIGAASGEMTVQTSVPPFGITQSSGIGSCHIKGRVMGNKLLWVGKNRRRVLEYVWDEQRGNYEPADLTYISHDIFDADLKDIAVQTSPFEMLHCVDIDGGYYTFGYNPAAGLVAWAKHDLGGIVESVAVIPGGEESEVWLTVQRGSDRTVEKFAPIYNQDFNHLDVAYKVNGNVACSGHTDDAGDVLITVDQPLPQTANMLVDIAGTDYVVTSEALYQIRVAGGAGLTPSTLAIRFNGFSGLFHPDSTPLYLVWDYANAGEILDVQSGVVEWATEKDGIIVAVGKFTRGHMRTRPVRTGHRLLKRITSVSVSLYDTMTATINGAPVTFAEDRYMDVPPDRHTVSETANNVDGEWLQDVYVEVSQEEPLAFTLLSLEAELEAGI